jgi:hypothetical protein
MRNNQTAYLAELFGLLNQSNVSLQGQIHSTKLNISDESGLMVKKTKGRKTYMFAAHLEESNSDTNMNTGIL